MSGPAQIQALRAAGLDEKILLPGGAIYESRINSWWSASARLRPCCIVQPQTADDVAAAVKALASVGSGGFAIRSGGHSHWPGGSSIADGVTIDLLHVNNVTTYDPATKVVSLGPAQRWGDVFLALEKKGVMVTGGRDGDVGVGGLITGGGNSYYTGRHGFVSVESSQRRTRIVTRFDVQAFEAGELWGGIRASDKSHTDDLITSLVEFTANNHKYPEAAYIINFTYQPTISKDVIVAQVLIDTDGVANPPAFEKVQKIPELFNDIKKRPMSGVANDYLLPANLRNVWFTLTFKNDTRVVKKAADLHESFAADLLKDIPADDLVTQSLWQPVPKLFADIGVCKGGNVLGLDEVEGGSLLWLCAASVRDAEHEPLLRRKVAAMIEELRAFAVSIDAMVPWIYVNYADPTQDPIRSYGKRNCEFMKEVAAKYDPDAVFQKMVPGSFKLTV